jgi:NADH dehydrogenase
MASSFSSLVQPGLVTLIGGSGFVGRALTEAFARAGWRVRVLCRNPGRAERLRPLGDVGQIAPMRGDIRIPASLLPALEGADAAINLVGILDEKSGQRFADVQAKGAGHAAQAAARQGVRAYVHMSAIGADRASPSAYGRTKGEGEAAVLAAFPGAAILRPSLVFGSEDGFTNRFAGLISAAPVIPVVAPETRFQPVYVGDLAAAALAVVQRLLAGGAGGIWELGGPEILTMRAIMAFIAKETGHEKPMIDTPDIGARMLASLGFLPGAPLTKDQYLMLKRDNIVSHGAADLTELGVAPTPMAAVAPGWLARYRTGGRFAGANS